MELWGILSDLTHGYRSGPLSHAGRLEALAPNHGRGLARGDIGAD